MRAVCGGCMSRCVLEEGQTGLCRARGNTNDTMVPINCGKITSMVPDPIEKEPLRRFLLDSVILSMGGFGCNLRCPFCQNHEVSVTGEGDSCAMPVSPEKLTKEAAELRIKGNVGVAYTCSEPLMGWEYARDTGRLVRIADMKNVIVTNGSVSSQALDDILPAADVMNIDLKGFTEQHYRKLDGDPETVGHFITRSSHQCHVELATLIIPGENDSDEKMREIAGWVSSLDPEIPLHVSRFFPRWRMDDRPATNVARVYELVRIAEEYLKYVWTDNYWTEAAMHVIFSDHAKFVQTPQPASLSPYFNSGTREQEGAVTMVTFGLNRSV